MMRSTKGAAFARSKSIDHQIDEDRERRQREVQLLILGGARTGKSTFIKQLRIQHGDGFPEVQRASLKPFVFENLVDAVLVVLDNMKVMGVNCKTPQNDVTAEKLQELFPRVRYCCLAAKSPDRDQDPCRSASTSPVPPRIDLDQVKGQLANMMTLIEDENFQVCYKCKESLQPRLAYAEEHFLESAARLVAPQYVPSIRDVLAIRRPTYGVQEHSFVANGLAYRVIDVAGQKNQRKKWIHFFDGVTAVVFFAALSGFCEDLEEERSLNSLHDSLATFKDVVENSFLEKTDFILFLNKKDVFDDRLKYHKMAEFFPEYKGDNSPEQCVSFVKNEFVKRKPKDKTLSCHVTCAVDTDMMRRMISELMQIIIEINLRRISTPL